MRSASEIGASVALCHSISLPLLAASALLAIGGCGPTQESTSATRRGRSIQLPTDAFSVAAMRQGDAHLKELTANLGFVEGHTFRARNVVVDKLSLTHVRFEQFYRGIRVWGGDAIVEVSAQQQIQSVVHTLQATTDLSIVPSLSQRDALQITRDDLRPQGPYTYEPTVELIVYPQLREQVRAERLRGADGELNALDIEERAVGYALAYHVHTALENGEFETRHTDYIIDAHAGAILKKWSTLYTADAIGSGQSQHSGRVLINTESVATGRYELNDLARSMSTYDLGHAVTGMGTLYSDSDNRWGDGNNYKAGNPTEGANGQTAAVDAHYGAAQTLDYFLEAHDRYGIDDLATPTYSRVHYGTSYDNAFWDDDCFCMTYGDGRRYKVMATIDVAGHEMTHGVISSTAELIYAGESGALNESLADIFGTMIEFYVKGGSRVPIGDTGGNWMMGEQLATLPLRYMDKPSKDGVSRDAWSSGIGMIDPHYSSGPMNRAFFFLSQGASSDTTDDHYSRYLPSGMSGIGNDKAAAIAYHALTTKMVSNTNYAGARTAFLLAAAELYGATSVEHQAVDNAFAAINVGIGGADTTAPITKITSPADGACLRSDAIRIEATATDNVGVTKVIFLRDSSPIGIDSTFPYSIDYSIAMLKGTYTFSTKAIDAASNSSFSPPVHVTIVEKSSSCAPVEDAEQSQRRPPSRPSRIPLSRLEP